MAKGKFKSLLDSELFLPESWDADRERCRAADIPDQLRYRPKWRIALELVAKAQANGWKFDWLTFDEGYGSKPSFLSILDLGGMQYVGEVPKIVLVPAGTKPDRDERRGRVFSARREATPSAIVSSSATNRSAYGVASESRGCGVGERSPDHGTDCSWHAIARPARSNTSLAGRTAAVHVRRLLAVAFTRWNVEHIFRVGKSEVGLTHFEARSYVSLKRHLALCLVVLAFVALQTMRLRGEKSRADHGANVPGLEIRVPPLPKPTTGNQ